MQMDEALRLFTIVRVTKLLPNHLGRIIVVYDYDIPKVYIILDMMAKNNFVMKINLIFSFTALL